jgi:hypothetical protein
MGSLARKLEDHLCHKAQQCLTVLQGRNQGGRS